MAKIDERYKRGQIYTIRCRYDDSLIYVGSTINILAKRMVEHRSHKKCSLYQYVDGDWDNWYIELYEEYPCNNKQILEKREGELIREIGTINKVIPGRTRKEYNQDNRDKILEKQKEHYQANREILLEKHKQYNQANRDKLLEKQKEHYQANRDKIAEKHKEYHEANKEKILEKQKEYRQDNREKLVEYQREYRQANHEKINEKITCDICGCQSARHHLKRHQKTKKCMNYNITNK